MRGIPVIVAAIVLGLEGGTAKSVLVVPIEGEINRAQRAYVQRIAERARHEKPDLLLFEIDTPGGDALSMLSICEEILHLNDQGFRTAAYVRRSDAGNWVAGTAASAGAFIALSCRKIYMGPATVIGASQPVVPKPGGGMESAGGKVISLFKKKISAIAKRNGYPEPVAIAMVDPEFPVYRVVEGETQRFLTEEEKETYLKQHEGARVEPLTRSGEPLTLTVDEAVKYGLATRADSRDEVLAAEGLEGASRDVEGFTWSEELVGFITMPAVQSILMLLALALGYMEIKTPGFGLFGMSSIALFALIFFGHHLAGLAEMTELLLVLAGMILVAVEIFALPGTLFVGILGGILVMTGLLLMLLPSISWDLKNPLEVDALLSAGARVSASFVLASIIFLVGARFLPQIPVLNKLVLQTSVGGGGDPAVSPLVGKTGLVRTRLAPGGKAEIDGKILDVVTEGEYVEAGEAVRVRSVQGSRIVVDRVEG